MHTQCKKSLYCVICTNWIVEANFFRTISGNGNRNYLINLPKLWLLNNCNGYSGIWMLFPDCELVLVKMIEVSFLSRAIEKTFIALLVSIIGNQLRLWNIHIDHVLTFQSHVWRFNFSLWIEGLLIVWIGRIVFNNWLPMYLFYMDFLYSVKHKSTNVWNGNASIFR